MTTFPLNTDQPEISEHPQNQIVLEGLNVSFLCNASGNPTPTFSWTINGSPVNSTSNPRITFSAYNKQLTITTVKRTDGGEYKCLASNSVNTVTSTAASLIVQCKETFTYVSFILCIRKVFYAPRSLVVKETYLLPVESPLNGMSFDTEYLESWMVH